MGRLKSCSICRVVVEPGIVYDVVAHGKPDSEPAPLTAAVLTDEARGTPASAAHLRLSRSPSRVWRTCARPGSGSRRDPDSLRGRWQSPPGSR